MRIRHRISSLFFCAVLIAAVSCENQQQNNENLAMLAGFDESLLGNLQLTVITTSPVQNQSDVDDGQQVEIIFSKPIHPGRCTSAFLFDNDNDGQVLAGGNALKFSPNATLSTGTHVAELTTDCEDLSGGDLVTPLTLTFNVGETVVPAVQAVGLESQGCSNTYPGTGSASGGDHTLGSCWWDSGLAVLSPTNYEFRGGDDGTGGPTLTNACTPDVTSDNFRVIFSQYMDPATTANAITLTRLSGTSTQIRAATHVWTDCQSVSPFGCRVITISFAEAEASCNGPANFGDNSTGGDFNLGQTDAPAVANFPLYRLEVDTTASSAEGTNLGTTFAFDVEGD